LTVASPTLVYAYKIPNVLLGWMNEKELKNMKRRIPLVLAAVFYLWSSVAAAQIYEWIDKNGIRHFTNVRPPPGAKIVNEQAAIPYDEAADQKRMQEDKEIHDRLMEQQESQTDQQASSKQETPAAQTGSSSSDNAGESVVEDSNVRNRDRFLRYGRPIPERGPIVTPLPSPNRLPRPSP
jgi:hypothetical protein